MDERDESEVEAEQNAEVALNCAGGDLDQAVAEGQAQLRAARAKVEEAMAEVRRIQADLTPLVAQLDAQKQAVTRKATNIQEYLASQRKQREERAAQRAAIVGMDPRSTLDRALSNKRRTPRTIARG